MPITAAQILQMDTRPIIEVEVPELGLTGENAAKVRELTPARMALINDSCEIDGKKDESKFMARVICEGCAEPKFEISEADALVLNHSNRAVRTLFSAIITGKKNGPGKS